MTACNASSAWFGGKGLKACNARGQERVWDRGTMRRTTCGTGQCKHLSLAFLAGAVQRRLHVWWSTVAVLWGWAGGIQNLHSTAEERYSLGTSMAGGRGRDCGVPGEATDLSCPVSHMSSYGWETQDTYRTSEIFRICLQGSCSSRSFGVPPDRWMKATLPVEVGLPSSIHLAFEGGIMLETAVP